MLRRFVSVSYVDFLDTSVRNSKGSRDLVSFSLLSMYSPRWHSLSTFFTGYSAGSCVDLGFCGRRRQLSPSPTSLCRGCFGHHVWVALWFVSCDIVYRKWCWCRSGRPYRPHGRLLWVLLFSVHLLCTHYCEVRDL